MQEYRHHIKHRTMKARSLTGAMLRKRAGQMGVKTADGLDLWSVALLKRLPMTFWDALAELLRMVERTGCWPDRVAEGFTSLVPKGEGAGDPMKLRPLTVLSQIYRIWAGVRMEDALQWQEQWVHPEAYGFRPHKGAIDAATVLTLLIELAQALKVPLVGVGTDYTKCFDLIPQLISMAILEVQGIDSGVLRAFRGMYTQLKRMFKIKGCLGAWWTATNGILQGCPLSVIVINALTTTWKRVIDDIKRPVTVTTRHLPPAPKEEPLPSCYWHSCGAGADLMWVWRCVQPCCCWEQGWIVDGTHQPPPNPACGGAQQPPPRPRGCQPGDLTPAAKVWGLLGLQEMPTPPSTEHSRASLRAAPSPGTESSASSEEPISPLYPRNLFGPDTEIGPSEDVAVTGGADQESAEDPLEPGVEITISAEGYADDTYMMTVCLLYLLAMLAATSKWLQLTGQEVNAKKSLAFSATSSTRKKPEALAATLDGVQIPVKQEFRQLGIGVRTVPTKGTGPLLKSRIDEGKKALKKTRTMPGGFDRKATVAAVMIVAASLYGVELADVSQKDLNSMETAIMTAIWGPSRPCRAKEIVFALLVPGHRVAPSMVIPYKRMCWLAQMARSPGTAQTVAQALWEHTTKPRTTGPFGRALNEFRKLGWTSLQGWWQWRVPRTGLTLHLVHSPKGYVEHLFRESLREKQLEALEMRRPRQFGGMGACLSRELTLSQLELCATELDKSLLRSVLTGAIWTADRAFRRGLRPDGRCPFCDKGVQEDENHLFWWCEAWSTIRNPSLPSIMLMARALKLGALSEWPPCLRICGLMPESVVQRSGLARGPGWKKTCKELHRVSRHWMPGPGEDWLTACRQRSELARAGQEWAEEDINPLEEFMHQLHTMFVGILHARKQKEEATGPLLFPEATRKLPTEEYPWYQLQLPQAGETSADIPEMGALPRDWKWGPDFLPALMRWLHELRWLRPDVTLPVGHRQVSFMELALDFESHAGRPLPPTPQSRFAGTTLSLQEKGRVLRLAVTLMGRAAGRESILPAGITTRCRSLVPLGAGTVVGVKGRPFFTRPLAVWHHLRRLQQYTSDRWACRQQSRAAKHRSKRRKCQKATATGPDSGAQQKQKCPGKGGAKRTANTYAGDFYAAPVVPDGVRRGPQYQVLAPPDDPEGPMPRGGLPLFTPPQRCPRARRPEEGPRLPKIWICPVHQHRQCASCATVGRGVRHCCSRGHPGHPRPTALGQQPLTARARTRRARTPGTGGGTPAPKRRREGLPSGAQERLPKRGRTDSSPPPAGKRRCRVMQQQTCHGRAGTEVT